MGRPRVLHRSAAILLILAVELEARVAEFDRNRHLT
jgi:hypothetical protein